MSLSCDLHFEGDLLKCILCVPLGLAGVLLRLVLDVVDQKWHERGVPQLVRNLDQELVVRAFTRKRLDSGRDAIVGRVPAMYAPVSLCDQNLALTERSLMLFREKAHDRAVIEPCKYSEQFDPSVLVGFALERAHKELNPTFATFKPFPCSITSVVSCHRGNQCA